MTPKHVSRQPSCEDMLLWRKRRRWATVGWMYGVLIACATFFISPYVVAMLASLKLDPLEQPFTFMFDRIKPVYWGQAWRLGKEAAGGPLLGGFKPGRTTTFDFTVAVPEGTEFVEPIPTLPFLQSGFGKNMFGDSPQPNQYIVIQSLEHIGNSQTVSMDIRKGKTFETVDAEARKYRLTLDYPLYSDRENPFLEQVPINMELKPRHVIIDADIMPERIERRGRIARWDQITPGWAGYLFRNYVRTFDDSRSRDTGQSLFFRWVMNSFVISVGRVLLHVAVATMAGYALARLEFPGKVFFFGLVLFSMTIPDQIIFISNYLVLRDFGLLNTPLAVISVALISPAAFIMKQFFETVPRVLEEASFIDGATPFQTFYCVVLPLAGPALGAVTIISFQSAWNDFFWPLVLITNPQEAYALPVGLLSFRNAYGAAGDWGMILAGAFLSMIPVLILFSVFQRYFVENSATSGIK